MQGHILIVEDEPSIVDNVGYAVRTEGFSFTACSTLIEAYEILKNETSLSLIVLDVSLPDGNGFEFCKKIRKFSDIPIIFLTARADEIDRIVGLEIGGDDYVTKPFSPRELTARIKVILRRVDTSKGTTDDSSANASSPDSQEQPVFQLNRNKYQLKLYNRDLELTRYEFRLFLTLAESPGRVFSREQLMDRVWEEPEASFDRTVDTHIKTLRSKIKDAANEGMAPCILTHRGIGYAFRESVKVQIY